MTLLAPLFLAGLLAVGLPLWLHRLSSTNPNRQRFSSLMFLEAGEPRRVLAKTLQYLLLLAMRIAVLVLLVLAFVQPAIWRDPQASGGEGAELHVIVMDTSASMSAGDRWNRATDAADGIIDALEDQDRGQLIAAGRVTELVTAATADRAELRQGIVATKPGVFHLNFGQLARALDGVLRGAELPVVLHLVTDAQQSGLPTRFAELAPRQAAELRIHDIAAAETNAAIESLSGSAINGELTAAIRSFSDRPIQKTVRLELNGELIEQRPLQLAAGERVQVGFSALTLAAGSNRVRASLLPADALPQDDSRIVALKRPVPRPVLLVAGELRGRDTLFVASAMGTLGALAIEPDTTTAAGLAERVLGNYRFVVVADAGALGANDQTRLRDYVESGGAVLMALGPRSASLTEVPITRQQFQAAAGIGRRGVGSEYLSIGALDASHPALRGVDTLRAAKFFRHTAITPAAVDRLLISLDGGAPLLLERELGAGRVLVFTSSLDKEWNDLPVQPVFVPFIAGIADHLLGGAGFSNEAALGSTLALRAMGMQGGQIFDPSGNPALRLGGGTDDLLLDQIGYYELVGGGNTELVAVNFDSRESDLRAVDAATIERWQALGRRADAEAAGNDAAQSEEAVLAPAGYWILVLLLAAVGVESAVGNWHLRIRRGMAA
jgi:hypothetical protein